MTTKIVIGGIVYTVGKTVRYCLSETMERAALIIRINDNTTFDLVEWTELFDDWNPVLGISRFDLTTNVYPCWKEIP